ncbi:MAG TPA: TVP38/TMEM64 family protein [Stellaceae bacterium]|nr:TVP38/TMEM64 family protein [Stellaceae bacterium]
MAARASPILPARRQPSAAFAALREHWPWLVFGLVLLALCLGWLLLPLRQWMDGLQSWLHGLGTWGVVIFGLILVFATFLPLPDWPLPIVAGYVFGAWAFLLVYVGIALPSALAFLAARHLARDRVRAFLGRRAKYQAVDKAVAKEGWRVVVLLRLSPIVPFNLQNYALCVTAIPFWQYLGATLLGIVPGIAVYVYFGMFGKELGGGASALDWALLGFGAAATVALGVVVTRRTRAAFNTREASRARRGKR